MRALALTGNVLDWEAWGQLLHSVKTGEPAFQHVHGMDPFAYFWYKATGDRRLRTGYRDFLMRTELESLVKVTTSRLKGVCHGECERLCWRCDRCIMEQPLSVRRYQRGHKDHPC